MDLDVGGTAVSNEWVDNSWVGNDFEGGSRMHCLGEMIEGAGRQGSMGGIGRKAAQTWGGNHIQDPYPPVVDGQDCYVQDALYC
jgi:hypothetical protein